MIKKIITVLLLILPFFLVAQVRVSGVIIDEQNETIPFANVVFKGTTVGTVSDENGKFYLESDKIYTELEVSFLGYQKKTITVKRIDYNLIIVLAEEANQLKEVVLYSGKVKNKGNPAIAILKKIWAKKRENGINFVQSISI